MITLTWLVKQNELSGIFNGTLSLHICNGTVFAGATY